MKKKSTKDKIRQEIRRSIITGHKKPGERLNIEDIADHYNTSVTPVRDALQMLCQEGLVNIKPSSGYYVKRITLKELHDMFELRRILELAAVEHAVENVTREQLDEMRNVHTGYTGNDDESYDRYTRENRRFHYLLAEASGNSELAAQIGLLHDRLARFMVLRRAGKTMEGTHAVIIDALEVKDTAMVKQTLLDDIEGTQEIALEKVIQKDADSWHLDV